MTFSKSIYVTVLSHFFFPPQSVREEEKEVYRQLLTVVSGGQSSFLHNGSSHTIVRSHRDLYVDNAMMKLLDIKGCKVSSSGEL